MVFGQKCRFLELLFFKAKQARKMSFTIFQHEKNPFQAIKTRSLKSRKIAIFLKGITHSFGPKMTIFLTSFSQAKLARKMCFTIFQNEKTSSQAIKTSRSKNGKIDNFLKGLSHRFSTKIAFFATSFYLAKQAWKMSFTIFQNEKTPFQAIEKEVQKLEKLPLF